MTTYYVPSIVLYAGIIALNKLKFFPPCNCTGVKALSTQFLAFLLLRASDFLKVCPSTVKDIFTSNRTIIFYAKVMGFKERLRNYPYGKRLKVI